ncbi:MAG: nitrate reductase cytochrome c-type subunit [Chromatiales bacterium]|nr:nitrate reductase cytochrome c-type subunit [Chromatiales bacterium]
MKMKLLMSLIVVSLGVGGAQAGDAVSDTDMGLSHTSVFDTPDPQAFTYSNAFPGSSGTLDRSFPQAPPQIPHSVEGLLPIKAHANSCQGCHDQPSRIGMEKMAGLPTPIPASHYTDLRREPDKVTGKVIGARYICTQCHAPQADVKPLVDNKF